MENLLEKVAGMLGGLWDWTVHLNGGLQIVLVDWLQCIRQSDEGRMT